ncbi:DUF2064 domain-containing protein [bacterium]|nr:DUF2064 domain-containing protein [bacterium]
MEARENALVIFTKNPVKGKIKTRLAKDIGETMALKVYMQLLKHTREITQDLDFCEKKIFYNEFIPARDNWKEDDYDKYVQGEGDLATKMANAYKLMFDEGYSRVIIMSPDCPEMTGARLKQAFTLLGSKDFVIGPLKDGGYYLLGMKRYQPEVIEGMEFGQGNAFSQTIERIQKLGASYKELPETFDVDYEYEIPPKLRKLVGLEETTANIDEEELEESEIEVDTDEFSSDDDEEDSGYGDEPDKDNDEEDED